MIPHICWRLRWLVFIVLLIALSGCGAPSSVYFGASDKNLYALLGKDGSLRWKNPLGGEVHTTPFYWAGQVNAAASDGVVYTFDADSGKLLWQTPLLTPQQAAQLAPQSVLSTPVMPVNGSLFVGTGLGDIFELNETTGAKTQRASLGVTGRQWLTASRDGSMVFVASTANTGVLYAVNRAAGGILWRQGVGMPTGPPVEGPNGGLVGPAQVGLVLLDFTHGGQIVTTYTAGGLIEGAVVDMQSGAVYVTTSTGAVQQLWLQAGSPPAYNQAWTVKPTTAAGYAPLFGGSGLIVTNVNGNAATITPNSGGFWWSLAVDTDLAAAPAYGLLIDASTMPAVVTVTSSGRVYALDPGRGTTIWKQASVVTGKVDSAVLVH